MPQTFLRFLTVVKLSCLESVMQPQHLWQRPGVIPGLFKLASIAAFKPDPDVTLFS